MAVVVDPDAPFIGVPLPGVPEYHCHVYGPVPPVTVDERAVNGCPLSIEYDDG